MRGLEALGWTPAFAEAFAALGDAAVRPARLVLEHGRFLRVHDGVEEMLAVASGRMRHEAATAAALPTVGDWVAIHRAPGEELAAIRHLLPRRTAFSRRRAGPRAAEQVVAANIDVVFLLMGLDGDFNLRRLERYLTVAYASGARPIVVLNKADAASDLPGQQAAVAGLGFDVTVVTTSARAVGGDEPLRPFLVAGTTIALLGSSGVGKSTLLNRLVGADVQRTGDVRSSDSRGRHTTSHAQLFPVTGGALVIDTPGLRELQLWEAQEGVETAFQDIEALAVQCRFRDCRHRDEPGCAIQAALAAGELSADRYASFSKLSAELIMPGWSTRRPRARRR